MKKAVLSKEFIERIKTNNLHKPDILNEDIETIDYKERRGTINIDYSYQRNFLQKEKEASAFVESVFLGLTIPEIQVYENYETGNREIVDGQQRTLSLLKFYRDEYALKGLTILSPLNGLKYSQLEPRLQMIFKKYCLSMRVSTVQDPEYKYTLFARLNLGSKILNKQEIRNCVYRESSVLGLAKKLAESSKADIVFEKITNNRFNREEFILDILALYLIKGFTGTTKSYQRIDQLLLTTSLSDTEISHIEQVFMRTCTILTEYFNKNTLELLKKDKKILSTIFFLLMKQSKSNAVYTIAKHYEKAIVTAIGTEEFKKAFNVNSNTFYKDVMDRAAIVSMYMKNELTVHGGLK